MHYVPRILKDQWQMEKQNVRGNIIEFYKNVHWLHFVAIVKSLL